LAKLVEAEENAAAIVGLVEVSGLFFDRELAQRFLDQLLGRGGEIVAENTVRVFKARGSCCESVGNAFVLLRDFSRFEELAVNAGLVHGLAVEAVARRAVPEFYRMGETVTLLMGVE
jgi:hypothetical protein